MSHNSKNYQKPSQAEIAACAYRIYELEGNPEGKATQHWLEAEAQLIAESKAQAGQFPAKNAAQSASGGHASRKSGNVSWSSPSRSRQHALAH